MRRCVSLALLSIGLVVPACSDTDTAADFCSAAKKCFSARGSSFDAGECEQIANANLDQASSQGCGDPAEAFVTCVKDSDCNQFLDFMEDQQDVPVECRAKYDAWGTCVNGTNQNPGDDFCAAAAACFSAAGNSFDVAECEQIARDNLAQASTQGCGGKAEDFLECLQSSDCDPLLAYMMDGVVPGACATKNDAWVACME